MDDNGIPEGFEIVTAPAQSGASAGSQAGAPSDGIPEGFEIVSAAAQGIPGAQQSAPPQAAAQAPAPEDYTDRLADLAGRYLGSFGQQAVRQSGLAARAIAEAGQHMVNMPADAAYAIEQLATNPAARAATWQQLGHPMSWLTPPPDAPSLIVSGALGRVLPTPQSAPEQLASGIESFLAGSRMPLVPGLDVPAPSPRGSTNGTAGALAAIERTLGKDNSSFGSAAARVTAANAAGIPLRLSDVGPNALSLGDVLTQRPGLAATTLTRDLEARLADAKLRVPAQVRAALGAQGDVGATSDALDALRSAHARANYEAVRQDGTPIEDPEIERILQNPVIANLYQTALNRRLQSGSLEELAGNAPPPLKELYTAKSAPTTVLDESGNPFRQPVYERTGTVPDTRTLDFLQREMDRQATADFQAARNGAATGDRAQGIANARKMLVNRLSALSPTFARARQTYGADSDMIDALQTGRSSGPSSFLAMSPAQAQDYVSGLSESAKAALRMGVAQRLLGTAELTGRNVNIARDALGGPRQLALLEPLFDNDPDKLDAFMKTMQLEDSIFKNSLSMLRGSQTFRRAEAANELSSDWPEKAGNALEAASVFHHPYIAVSAMLRLMGKRVWNTPMANRVAQILASPDPQQAVEALSSLDRAVNGVTPMSRRLLMGTKGLAGASVPPYQSAQAPSAGLSPYARGGLARLAARYDTA